MDAACVPWKTGNMAGAVLLAVLALGMGPRSVLAAAPPSAPTRIPLPLVACWTFDEVHGSLCRDTSNHGWDATSAPDRPALVRTRGLFGRALALSDRHHIRVSAAIPLAHPAGLSLTAWVKPTQLSSYREIFRKEDGEERVLFSFQEDGKVLSLGLNTGRYDECDAVIDPARVADGRWHHCAATYDGRWMRVYLDGAEVGCLQRPGRIRAGGAAPACIGSSNGGENFQGEIDDLRIYAGPLDRGMVAALYRDGLEAMERASGQLAGQVSRVYRREVSFAATLMRCRQQVLAGGFLLDADLARSVVARLRADFPADHDTFTQHAGCDLAGYLVHADPEHHRQAAREQVDLLLEYRPITAEQWARQTPQDVRKWQELGAYRGKLDALQAGGEAARFSPAWVELLVDAGRQVERRPLRSEPVAPYVQPHTPVTRDHAPGQAQELLQRDWLFQADGNPTPGRIREEIGWTRQLAERIERAGDAPLHAERAVLDALARQAAALTRADPALYFQVRQIKRRIAFKNPVIDFSKVLFVDMPFPQGSEWRHETRHRLGYLAVPGGRLLTLDGLSPGGKLTQLMPRSPLHGSFWRPDLSYDGRQVLFCYKPHNEKAFHLYQIGIDGSGLVQLTDGPFDDLDPIYLPDDKHLLFTTTRGHTYVRCMPPTNAFVLARCDRDGKNVYLISQNNEPDYLPSVLPDGRVLYTRWEYTDKPLWRAQKLWTVNPDGTQVNTYWGNQSVWPDVMKDARAIPGTRRVLFTGCGHHDWFAGSVGIIEPGRGFNFPAGLTKVTAELPWPEVGNGPVDPVESARYHPSGRYTAYYSPYPLGPEDFLVSAQRDGKFVLLLMDVHGNRELIYEGTHHLLHAIPVRPRLRPPALPDRVAWPRRDQRDRPQNGVLFSGNVYQNAPAELRGRAKFLRVLSIDPKTYTYWDRRPYISTGPVVSVVQSEGVKRILGTVAIESDGSVAFQVPAGKALHFQLLDEHQRALQTMRSFVGVMPGEHRGCLGCHESHSRAPQLRGGQALARPPRDITPPAWADDTVSYPRYVRPVLDAYCGKCHGKGGDGYKTLDLTARPGPLGFDEVYWTLTGRPTWGQPYQAPVKPPPAWGIADMLLVEGYSPTDPKGYQTPAPLTKLSYRSRLIELASSGKHHGVKLDPISLLRLSVWVDAMCPYNGDEEVRAEADPMFPGIDWLSVRPRVRTAPRIVRPGPVD